MIEDELFKEEIKEYNLTKDKYIPSEYSHYCTMCGQYYKGYKRKDALDATVPYLFICIDCYEELPNKEGE